MRNINGWAFIYDRTTGDLVSQGTVVADPLPQNLAIRIHPSRPDSDVERWDRVTKAVERYTNTDRIKELEDQIAALQSRLDQLLAV